MDERVGCGSEPRDPGGAKHDREPAPMQRVGEVGIVGDLKASAELELIGAHGHGSISVTVDPDGLPDRGGTPTPRHPRSEEHTSELQSQSNLVCRLLLEKKKKKKK